MPNEAKENCPYYICDGSQKVTNDYGDLVDCYCLKAEKDLEVGEAQSDAEREEKVDLPTQ